MSSTIPRPSSTFPTESAASNQAYALTLLLHEIKQLVVSEDEDDEETMPSANRDSIERAQSFVTHLYASAVLQNKSFYLPSVFAARDESVQLFWKADRRQTLLIIWPDNQTGATIVR